MLVNVYFELELFLGLENCVQVVYGSKPIQKNVNLYIYPNENIFIFCKDSMITLFVGTEHYP